MDDATDVLLRPWRRRPPLFEDGDTVLFLGARPHPELVDLIAPATLVAVQPFVPWAEGLAGPGVEVRTDEDAVGSGHAAALVQVDRQTDVVRGRIGRALQAVRPGGEVLVCGLGKEGGNRAAKLLDEVAGPVIEETKKRCRVARTVVEGLDADVIAELAATDAPRPVMKGTAVSRPGVFGWDWVDGGTRRLAEALPPLEGRAAQAGAAWGWLTGELLANHPGLTSLDVLEADARSLACVTANVDDARLHTHHVDATVTWPVRDLDWVVTNPPFHVGGKTDPEIGRAFLAQAQSALAEGGVLYLVANRQLPYERTLDHLFPRRWRKIGEKGGFKVIAARKGPPLRARHGG